MASSDDTIGSEGMSEEGVSVEILDEGPCQKRMRVEVSADAVSKELDSNYDQLRDTVAIPGFRKGRVPRALLEKRFSEQIEGDVKEEMIQNTFLEQIEKESLQILGQPKFEDIEFKAGEPLKYATVFEVVPSFELPDYKSLEIEAEEVVVADDAVQEELDKIREQFATFEDVAFGEQENDDMVRCDLTIHHGEEEILNREDAFLKVGHDHVDNIDVEGLSEKLLGAKEEGAQIELQATFPDDFPREDLRGQGVMIRATLKEQKRRVLAELNDEFAKQFQMESMADLEAETRSNLEKRAEDAEKGRQEEALVDLLLSQINMDLPAIITEQRTNELSQQRRYELMREGKSPEEVEKAISEDTSFEEDAKNELRRIFVLDQIADKETVLVTEDEVATRLQLIAATYGRPFEEVQEEYRKSGMLEDLRGAMRREKTRQFIRKRAKVKGAKVEETETDSA